MIAKGNKRTKSFWLCCTRLESSTLGILLALFVPIACASTTTDSGKQPGTGVCSTEITQYSWHATWGPCLADAGPCEERLDVRLADGRIERTLGALEVGWLTGDELVEFSAFLCPLLDEISNVAPCTSNPSHDRVETVVLTLEHGLSQVSKEVLDCGDLYESINGWNRTLREKFPD